MWYIFFMHLNPIAHPGTYTATSHCEVNNNSYEYPIDPSKVWNQWVVVTDAIGTSTRFFINGSKVFTSLINYTNTYVTGTDLAFGIGVYHNGTAPWSFEGMGYLNGTLDEIRIFNRALSSNEIQALYHEGEWIGSIKSLRTGWNMVSLPAIVPDAHRKTVFPPAALYMYYYYGSLYHLKDTLENGIGYWMTFESDTSVNIIGATVESDTLDIIAGWNMIGSISVPISVQSISSYTRWICHNAILQI